MTDFIFESFLYIVAIGLYLFVSVKLEPFKVHRKRVFSTISFKTSYLLYLSLLFVFLFLSIFSDSSTQEGFVNEQIFYPDGYIIGIMVIVPNVLILLRRNIVKFRVAYNYIGSIINLICTAYLLFLFFYSHWISY